jgi:protein CpxP
LTGQVLPTLPYNPGAASRHLVHILPKGEIEVNKLFFFMACLLALVATAPRAARAAQEPGSSQQQARRSWPTPEEVVSRLDSKLSLSDDQKAKITPIIADRQQKLKALAADTSMRRWKKARKMKSVFQDSDKKIKALLTDDQKQKYTQMEQEMRDRARQRMQERKSNGSSQ